MNATNPIFPQIVSLHEKCASAHPRIVSKKIAPAFKAWAQALSASIEEHFRQYEVKGSGLQMAHKELNACVRGYKDPSLGGNASNEISHYLNHLSLVAMELVEDEKNPKPEAIKELAKSVKQFEKDLSRFDKVRLQIGTGKTALGTLFPTTTLNAATVSKMDTADLGVLAANIDQLNDPKYDEVKTAMVNNDKLSLHAMKFLQNAGGLSSADKKTLKSKVDTAKKAKKAAKQAAEEAKTADSVAKAALATAKKAKADKVVGAEDKAAVAAKLRTDANEKIATAKKLAKALPVDIKVDAAHRTQALQFKDAQEGILKEKTKAEFEAAKAELTKTVSALTEKANAAAEVVASADAAAAAKAKEESTFTYKAKAFFSSIGSALLSPFKRFANWFTGLFSSGKTTAPKKLATITKM